MGKLALGHWISFSQLFFAKISVFILFFELQHNISLILNQPEVEVLNVDQNSSHHIYPSLHPSTQQTPFHKIFKGSSSFNQ